MRLYSQSFSLRAQLVLHAWRRCSLLAVGVAAALLLAGLSAPAATDALQLRVSPQISSFSASPSAASPVSAAAAAPTPSFVGYSGNESATAAALPVTLRAATHAAITDSHLASTTSTGSGSSRRRTAASTGTLVSPASSAATAAAAVQGRPSAVEGSSAIAAPPANGAPAAATGAPAAIAAPASRAATRLAYVNSAPSPSSRACRRLYSSGSRKEKRNSWSSSCQQQPIEDAVAAVSGSKYGRRRSWLHTPPLHQQRLAAAPAGASGGAVVEGEKVNGKSVRDWKVERTLYQALHMALAEEMHRDPSVCVMGEDVGHYGGSYKVTKDLHAVFGNLRVMDTPICENTFTGMAIGAAMNGLRPVVEGMNMGFLLLAFNQISNNAGMVRYTSGGSFDVPVVIRGPGGVGKQLGPEHSQRIEAYLMAVPGLKMVACSTPYNARGLLKSAIREDNPVVFFEHVLTYNMKEEIPLLPYTLPLDRAEVVREGNDVTVLAYGKLRYVALEAAKQLDSLGVSTEVVDLISLKPLDMVSVCKSLRKTGRCVILDESSKTGGIGGEILSQVVENCADELLRPPVRLATKDIPTPYARELEDATIVTPADVVNAALWMMSSRSQPTIGRHLA